MNRRTFVAGLGALLAAPLGAEGQRTQKLPRIGFLGWDGCPQANSVFGLALNDLGYMWGQTIHVVCRSADGDHGRLSDAATALTGDNVDVIAALTHTTAYAARRTTQSTPIVMIASGDPVRTGLVGSVARPGGNVTGVTYYTAELTEKRLQLLKEIVPGAKRIAVLGNSQTDHVFGVYRQDAERAARLLGLQLLRADVSQPGELSRAFEAFVVEGAHGLLLLPDPTLRAQARHIADLAAQRRLPAIYWGPWFVEVGGLAAYAPDYDAMVRRAAYYVDRILKGARPADLPVEQPTTFKLLINLKTAKALGLTIPPSLLLRADQVIE